MDKTDKARPVLDQRCQPQEGRSWDMAITAPEWLGPEGNTKKRRPSSIPKAPLLRGVVPPGSSG